MTDPLFLTAAVCISTACVLSYFLGRYLGIAAAYESLRPPLSRDGEALGDCWPHEVKIPVHEGVHTDARA